MYINYTHILKISILKIHIQTLNFKDKIVSSMVLMLPYGYTNNVSLTSKFKTYQKKLLIFFITMF